MLARRFAFILGALFPATVFAVDLVDLDFNITIPVNSSAVIYSDGWTGVWNELQYDILGHTDLNQPAFAILSVSKGICLYGRFEPIVMFISLSENGRKRINGTSTEDQTVVCVEVPYYSPNIWEGWIGIEAIKGITVMSRMKVPRGSSADDILITNQPFVSDKAGLTFNATSTIGQDGLHFDGEMNFTLPMNTFFAIKSPSDPTFAGLEMKIGPVWPEQFSLRPEQWSRLRLSNQNTSRTPADTPLGFSGPLDPTIQHTVQFRTTRYGEGGFTLSSMDLYSFNMYVQLEPII
jgi:hypothetical protein